jgi:hypothetical protein
VRSIKKDDITDLQVLKNTEIHVFKGLPEAEIADRIDIISRIGIDRRDVGSQTKITNRSSRKSSRISRSNLDVTSRVALSH